MTTPVGHPDFQAYAQWRGPVFAASAPNITIGTPFHVEENVTNFASVYLHAKLASGTGFTATITFYTDSSKTVLLRTLTWKVVFANGTLAVIVPCLGNFMTLDLTTAQAGTQGATVQLVPLNIAPPRDSYVETDAVNGGQAQSIPAGGTMTGVIETVVKGTGYMHASSANTTDTNSISLFSLDEAGNGTARVARIISQAGSMNLNFLAPGVPIQWNITNNGAAAQNFSFIIQILEQ